MTQLLLRCQQKSFNREAELGVSTAIFSFLVILDRVFTAASVACSFKRTHVFKPSSYRYGRCSFVAQF